MIKLATLFALLMVALAGTANAWGPGGCRRAGLSNARCCQHEAHWCWGGDKNGRNHCTNCESVCGAEKESFTCTHRARGLPTSTRKCNKGSVWASACKKVRTEKLRARAFDHV